MTIHTEPDLLSRIRRQKERQETHERDDGCWQNQVDDVVERTPLQVNLIRDINVWLLGVHIHVSLKRNSCTEISVQNVQKIQMWFCNTYTTM